MKSGLVSKKTQMSRTVYLIAVPLIQPPILVEACTKEGQNATDTNILLLALLLHALTEALVTETQGSSLLQAS